MFSPTSISFVCPVLHTSFLKSYAIHLSSRRRFSRSEHIELAPSRTLTKTATVCTLSIERPHRPVPNSLGDCLPVYVIPPAPNNMPDPSVDVLFSDLDGTLVHSPKSFSSFADIVSSNEDDNTALIRYRHSGETRKCVALPSKTAGFGYISLRTIELVEQLRKTGVIFVIITGARSSTYAKRRPYLPEADFEFCENGGRMLANGVLDPTWSDTFSSIVGNISDRCSISPDLAPPSERQGPLWRLYQELEDDGWNLDARDYSTNFRVDISKSKNKSEVDFERDVIPRLKTNGLTTTFNLGKADIYPLGSGKANAARHILKKLSISAQNSVALFDDDNDLELGALCGASFLPSVTHSSVLRAVDQHPNWTVMQRAGFLGTEDALERVIAMRNTAVQAKEVLTSSAS